MNIFKKITNPLEKRRIECGYSQMEMSKLIGITQSQYSRIEKGETKPNKHIKKLSKIFKCKPNEVIEGKILREINNDLLNEDTNRFQRTFHDRKQGFVHLKITGWFTRKQIISNYEILIKELDEWKVNDNGIKWKHR